MTHYNLKSENNKKSIGQDKCMQEEGFIPLIPLAMLSSSSSSLSASPTVRSFFSKIPILKDFIDIGTWSAGKLPWVIGSSVALCCIIIIAVIAMFMMSSSGEGEGDGYDDSY